VLANYGIEFEFVDTSDVTNVEAAIKDNTKMVFVETPTNPVMMITDLKAVSDLAHAAGARVVCDNTFMSPYLQRPIEFGVDIVVHSTIHPVMGPERGSGMPPPIFFRQSAANDLGAMAQRAGAKHLVLTHLIPPPGAPVQGIWTVPGGPLTEASYTQAAREGGFTGNVIVATDLASLRLPAK
jgi:hypothetical protein